jgi:hypothetical protein
LNGSRTARAGAICLAVLCAVSKPVAAQTPEASEAAIHSDGVDPMQASPTQREQAQARFLRGKELFDQGSFEAALVEFDASRAIVASPNTRLYRARCLRQLGRTVLAYTELGRTMVEALELQKLEARYARTVEAATEERKELAAHLGFVNVTIYNARAETKLFVNGEEIRRTAWGEPVPSAAGPVEVRVQSPGLPDSVKQPEVTAGASTDLTIELAAETKAAPGSRPVPRVEPHQPRSENTERSRSLRTYAYLAGGLGVAGLGTFGVLGAMSQSDYRKLDERCPEGRCPSNLSSTIDRGETLQRVANIGLAVGLAGAGAAVTLWLLEPKSESSPRLSLSIKPGSVQLKGRL